MSFLPCVEKIGFYPVVDSVYWVKQCITWGVKSIQLRIKEKPYSEIIHEVKDAVVLCKEKGLQLFINDYWELAIECGAYGVHLGQSDLDDCDLVALRASNIRCGISTHNDEELNRALLLSPSYIALGPIYFTTAKPMPFVPQGVTRLKEWRHRVACQLVAIGGITLNNIQDVLSCHVDGVALISALTRADNPSRVCEKFIKECVCLTDMSDKYV